MTSGDLMTSGSAEREPAKSGSFGQFWPGDRLNAPPMQSFVARIMASLIVKVRRCAEDMQFEIWWMHASGILVF